MFHGLTVDPIETLRSLRIDVGKTPRRKHVRRKSFLGER